MNHHLYHVANSIHGKNKPIFLICLAPLSMDQDLVPKLLSMPTGREGTGRHIRKSKYVDLCAPVSLCVSICLCLCVPVCISVCRVHIFMCVSVCLYNLCVSLCVPKGLYLYVCLCISVYVSLLFVCFCVFMCVSMCISVCLCVYLCVSVYLCVCLCVYPCICFFLPGSKVIASISFSKSSETQKQDP